MQKRSRLSLKLNASSDPSELENDFTEVRAAFQVFQSLAGFLERKLPVDDWFQSIRFDGAIHVFKHLARAHEDALHSNGFSKMLIGLKSLPLVRIPIRVTRPPMRAEFTDLDNVPAPPTSTT
jgi:hypothetical protein